MSDNPNSAQPKDLGKEREEMLGYFQDALLSPLESSKVSNEQEERIDVAYEHEKLSLENRLEKKALRNVWNKILTSLVITGFFLSYLLIILIGCGVLNFDNNAFAVPSVVAAGIVETYGLAKLAIKYFFSEDGEAGTGSR